MPRSEPSKPSKGLSPGESHSEMKPLPPTTGVRPRAKPLPPKSTIRPWKPPLPPHALRRKLKPSDGPAVMWGSIIRGTETARITDHPTGETGNLRQRETGRKPDPHPKEKEQLPKKKDALEESRKLRKRKSASPSRKPYLPKKIIPELSSALKQNPLSEEETTREKTPQLPHDDDPFEEIPADYGGNTPTDSSPAAYTPSGSESISGDSAELSFSASPITRVEAHRTSMGGAVRASPERRTSPKRGRSQHRKPTETRSPQRQGKRSRSNSSDADMAKKGDETFARYTRRNRLKAEICRIYIRCISSVCAFICGFWI